jgi:hypothetical protein
VDLRPSNPVATPTEEPARAGNRLMSVDMG